MFFVGVVTPTEITRALDLSCEHSRFFPAEAAVGVAALRALAGPFAHTCLKFIAGERDEVRRERERDTAGKAREADAGAVPSESAVAASLCRRSPKYFASRTPAPGSNIQQFDICHS